MTGEAESPRLRLVDELARFGRTSKGFVSAFSPDAEIEPAARYRDLDFLRGRLLYPLPPLPGRVAPSTTEVRSAASRFVRSYCQAMIRPVLIGLAADIGMNVALDRVTIAWAITIARGIEIQEPHEFHIEDSDISSPASWPDVLRSLFADNLAVLFDLVLQVVKLSPQNLWSSAAESVGATLALAKQRDGDVARRLVTICEEILDGESLPGFPGPNPMLGHIHWDPVEHPKFPLGLMRRKVCCICFKLPDRFGNYCGACPIPTTEFLVEFITTAPGATRPDRTRAG